VISVTDRDAYYFGPSDESGHFFWTTTGQYLGFMRPVDLDLPWENVDGSLLPKDRYEQGRGQFHIKDRWVALSIHDYTVDPRRGSHSTFFLRGGYRNVPMMLEELRMYQFFANILDRIGELNIIIVEE
jgi:hypothetical protein